MDGRTVTIRISFEAITLHYFGDYLNEVGTSDLAEVVSRKTYVGYVSRCRTHVDCKYAVPIYDDDGTGNFSALVLVRRPTGDGFERIGTASHRFDFTPNQRLQLCRLFSEETRHQLIQIF